MCADGFPVALNDDCTIFLGGTCNADLDECASHPCEHGARCLESATDLSIRANTYSCTCPPGWSNGICDFDYSPDCTVGCVPSDRVSPHSAQHC